MEQGRRRWLGQMGPGPDWPMVPLVPLVPGTIPTAFKRGLAPIGPWRRRKQGHRAQGKVRTPSARVGRPKQGHERKIGRNGLIFCSEPYSRRANLTLGGRVSPSVDSRLPSGPVTDGGGRNGAFGARRHSHQMVALVPGTETTKWGHRCLAPNPPNGVAGRREKGPAPKGAGPPGRVSLSSRGPYAALRRLRAASPAASASAPMPAMEPTASAVESPVEASVSASESELVVVVVVSVVSSARVSAR